MNEKLIKLATSLVGATERGQVKWDATLSDVFRASVGSGYVTVAEDFQEIGGTNELVIVMKVTDRKGRVVDTAVFRAFGEESNYGNYANELFLAARRSALNSSSIVDDMLAAIGGK